MKTLISKAVGSTDMMNAVAKDIATILSGSGNFSVFLEGGLGAGKTFLVRAILTHLGITEPITSPTYTYVNEYETDDHHFAHFDFYRLAQPVDFFTKGFDEIAQDAQIACFSEWVDKLPESARQGFTGKKFVIRIDFGTGVGMRKIKFLEV